MDARTEKWSSGKRSRHGMHNSTACVSDLVAALEPAAFAVERQDLDAISAAMLRRSIYFKPPLVAARMNFHGMAAVVRLMNAHAATMNLSYSAAIRMRFDLGIDHIVDHHMRLPARGWSAVRARALQALAASATDGGMHAVSQPRALHGCHAFSPGVKGGDNCFWAAPAAVLSEVLLHVVAQLDRYLPVPEAPLSMSLQASRRQQSTLGSSTCRQRLLRIFPEAVLLCAMNDTGVLGCAVNCSGCRSVDTPCGLRSPYCVDGGSCPIGCCNALVGTPQWQFPHTAVEAYAVASRVRALINSSRQDLFTVRRRAGEVLRQQANAAAPNELAADLERARAALASIAQQLTEFPSRMPWRVHILALFPAYNIPAVHRRLQGAMDAIHPSDFSVFHYDALGTSSSQFRAFARHEWYSRSNQIVHRSFGSNASTCINVGWVAAMSYMIDGAGSRTGYTHLWKFDADLDFGLFSFPAFRALLAFGAPFLSQPAILPMAKGTRSSDRSELQALYVSTHISKKVGPTYAVAGRERLRERMWVNEVDKPFDARRPYKGRVRCFDDIETMCPCVDAGLLRAILGAIRSLDPANEIGLSEVMNRIAVAAADASRAAGSPRPAGLVLDYTPLVHTDSKLRNWLNGAYTEVKTNITCPRRRVRPEMPPGAWKHLMPSSWPNIRAGFLDVSTQAEGDSSPPRSRHSTTRCTDGSCNKMVHASSRKPAGKK